MAADIDLTGLRIGFLVANEGVERVELEQPWEAVTRACATAVLVAPEAGAVQTFDHLDRAAAWHATLPTTDIDPADLDAVVLPGGVANPDRLRTDEPAVRLVRALAGRGTPIAAICHAPWTLVEADVVRGRTITSWPSLRTDLANAGAKWVDREVVVDEEGRGPLVSSRKPGDLPAFCGALLEVFGRVRTA